MSNVPALGDLDCSPCVYRRSGAQARAVGVDMYIGFELGSNHRDGIRYGCLRRWTDNNSANWRPSSVVIFEQIGGQDERVCSQRHPFSLRFKLHVVESEIQRSNVTVCAFPATSRIFPFPSRPHDLSLT